MLSSITRGGTKREPRMAPRNRSDVPPPKGYEWNKPKGTMNKLNEIQECNNWNLPTRNELLIECRRLQVESLVARAVAATFVILFIVAVIWR